ncbi:uncharacterized protein FFB14_04668 [Fusarium fujikuroi]|nr:uncharacterized protein FFB14_04668 [Fusarium fujikuroi]
MKINIVALITLKILPVLSQSTGNPEIQIQCPTLPPNQHVSRLHCKMADGSLVHVDGPGPFDCEMSYVAVRPPTGRGSTNQDSEELSSKRSEHCELLLIKLTDDGVVQHRCCKGGVAVFATQEHQVPSPQPVDATEGMQKPIRHLLTDEYDYEEDDYEDDDEEESDEDEEDDYEDYGVDEDINDGDFLDSGAGQQPKAEQDTEFKDL